MLYFVHEPFICFYTECQRSTTKSDNTVVSSTARSLAVTKKHRPNRNKQSSRETNTRTHRPTSKAPMKYAARSSLILESKLVYVGQCSLKWLDTGTKWNVGKFSNELSISSFSLVALVQARQRTQRRCSHELTQRQGGPEFA